MCEYKTCCQEDTDADAGLNISPQHSTEPAVVLKQQIVEGWFESLIFCSLINALQYILILSLNFQFYV